jgi:hypothetical protein
VFVTERSICMYFNFWQQCQSNSEWGVLSVMSIFWGFMLSTRNNALLGIIYSYYVSCIMYFVYIYVLQNSILVLGQWFQKLCCLYLCHGVDISHWIFEVSRAEAIEIIIFLDVTLCSLGTDVSEEIYCLCYQDMIMEMAGSSEV